MATIQLTQGCEAIVDDDMLQFLSQFTWHVHRTSQRKPSASKLTPYARTWISAKERPYMHQLVLPCRPGFVPDHIAENSTLDNRRQNLQEVPQGINIHRAAPKAGRRFKGVYPPRTKLGGFRAVFLGKHLGTFLTEEEAARAYDAAALEKFGRYARLNLPIVGAPSIAPDISVAAEICSA